MRNEIQNTLQFVLSVAAGGALIFALALGHIV
ncbi:hypothetical protein TRM7557_01090 [Tritonibacter multivorans]|uniref:Uncharacterized protein n=1 Tax=Tritonibacter multivorans TaxID=928856 RepID=A0A0P1G4T5_9RHOB|nr:hypothetical protein TRM7557_01090 [Tritonibacter multivorans]